MNVNMNGAISKIDKIISVRMNLVVDVDSDPSRVLLAYLDSNKMFNQNINIQHTVLNSSVVVSFLNVKHDEHVETYIQL